MRRDLSEAHGLLGGALQSQGKLSEALKSYRTSLAMVDYLVKTNPNNYAIDEWKYSSSLSHEAIASILYHQGNLKGALAEYKMAHDIREHLLKAHPANASYQRSLIISHTMIGRILKAQRKPSAAAEEYRAALALAELLARNDPTNLARQYELATCHVFIGDLLIGQQNTAGAIDRYSSALAILQRLAAADPENFAWLLDIGLTHSKIGNVREVEGNLPLALESYSAGLAISERLAGAEPESVGSQLMLATNLGAAADVYRRLGEPKRALEMLRRSHSIFWTLWRSRAIYVGILPVALGLIGNRILRIRLAQLIGWLSGKL
jgi:tetratricopeptide (TPR) repeat protein